MCKARGPQPSPNFNDALLFKSLSTKFTALKKACSYFPFSIIENGIKYSPLKTCLKIKLLSQEENMVILEVEDNGPGIPKEDMEKIFTKFYRGENVKHKTKGTGIGLYTAKTVVEAMGGRITVESINGNGSRFRMEFKQTHKKLANAA
jgi:hypothetical protein